MPRTKYTVLYFIFAAVFVAALYLGYVYFRETGSLVPKNTASQLSAEISEKLEEKTKIEWDDLLMNAREDCKTVGELKFPEEYFIELRSDVFAALNIEEDTTLESLAEPIPRTDTCWAIWVGDDEGAGFGGYRTTSDNVAVYSIELSEEVLREKFP